MVIVSDLLEIALRTGMFNYAETHEKWIKVQFAFATISGGASLATFAPNTRLDLLLRQIESETLANIDQQQEGEVRYLFDFEVSLAELWVMRSYELLRAARERTRDRGEQFPQKLQALLHTLELVRMPIDKGEIAKAKKNADISLALQDGTDERKYVAGDFILPRGVCGKTGAIMWWPVDIKSNTSVEVCRRDLSDWFLAAFD